MLLVVIAGVRSVCGVAHSRFVRRREDGKDSLLGRHRSWWIKGAVACRVRRWRPGSPADCLKKIIPKVGSKCSVHLLHADLTTLTRLIPLTERGELLKPRLTRCCSTRKTRVLHSFDGSRFLRSACLASWSYKGHFGTPRQPASNQADSPPTPSASPRE